jgi:hypothetical protein
MSLDIKQLGTLIDDGRNLVDKIRSGALSIDEAAQAVDSARQEAERALQIDANGNLAIDYADKDAQRSIMAKIVELEQAITTAEGDPALVGALRVDLADQYLNLANIQNATVTSIVAISAADRTQIANLLQGAALDAAKRKQMAALLGAAVSVTQALLKVAASAAA